MLASKQFLIKNNLVAVKRYKVPSKSEPNKYHIINEYADGRTECDCMARMNNRFCRHLRLIQHKNKNLYEENN